MKYLYKYPQAAFPYADLVETSRSRGRNEFEYELLDTGVFDEDRYFDVFVEYAKDIARGHPRSRSRVHNRGPEAGRAARPADALVPQPVVLARRRRPAGAAAGRRDRGASASSEADRRRAGRALPLLRGRRPAAVHRERDQHAADLRRPQPHPVRQGQHQRLRRPRPAGRGEPGADRDEGRGPLPPDGRPRRVPGRSGCGSPTSRRPTSPGQRRRRGPVRQPLRRGLPGSRARRPTSSTPPSSRRRSTPTQANVMRQALAGMLWSKQFYHYDVDKWLEERGSDPFKATRKAGAAQRPLAPHVQRRRHLDAGQVGVPLVRRLGPRLPRPRPDARRPGLRQAAAQADAARAVHAPQRPDPGLRVELRRRQPAGARLVHHLHLPPGEGADGRGRHGTGSRAASRSCC